GVQGQEARILNVAAGQNRTTLRWPYSLANPGRDNQRHQKGSGEFGPARREHSFESALSEQPGNSDPKDGDRYPGQDKRGGAQASPPSEPNSCLPVYS